MQCACALLHCHVACPVLPYFSTLPHKRYDFQKKVTEHCMCGLIFSTTFVWNISHSKIIQRDIIINVRMSSCKVPVILVSLQWNLNFLDIFSENMQYSNVKFSGNPSSLRWVVPCGQMDRRTDRQRERDRQTDTKLTITCRNFASALRNCILFTVLLFPTIQDTFLCRLKLLYLIRCYNYL